MLEVKGPKDVETHLNQLRADVDIAMDRTKAVDPEVLVRVAGQIEAIKALADENSKELQRVAEMAKINARTTPSAKLDELAPLLRSIPTSGRPDEGYRGSREFYNFLTTPLTELREYLPEEAVAAAERARRLHDTLVIADAAFSGVGGSVSAAYQRAGGVKSLRLWTAFQESIGPFERAMSTTGAGTGTEWVPTGYTSQLIEDIRQDLALANMIQTVNMPQNPYLYPVQGLAFKSFLIGEGAAISQRNVASLNLTFNAVKHAALILTSTELEEDSIVPIVMMIRQELAWAIAAGLEDAILNGQKLADTGWINSQPDTAFGLGADPTNVRNSYNGIRMLAHNLAAFTRLNLNGGIATESMTQMKGSMGRFGIKPKDGLWVTGYLMFAKLLTLKDTNGFAVVLTQDKMGSQNTFGSGTLGSAFGSPIVVCEDYPQNMDANGLVTAANGSLTGIHYLNTRSAKLGIRRGVQIEASRDRYFDQDQLAFRATFRSSLKFIQPPSATYKFAASGVNMATS